jgi:hypothetical protein
MSTASVESLLAGSYVATQLAIDQRFDTFGIAAGARDTSSMRRKRSELSHGLHADDASEYDVATPPTKKLRRCKRSDDLLGLSNPSCASLLQSHDSLMSRSADSAVMCASSTSSIAPGFARGAGCDEELADEAFVGMPLDDDDNALVLGPATLSHSVENRRSAAVVDGAALALCSQSSCRSTSFDDTSGDAQWGLFARCRSDTWDDAEVTSSDEGTSDDNSSDDSDDDDSSDSGDDTMAVKSQISLRRRSDFSTALPHLRLNA